MASTYRTGNGKYLQDRQWQVPIGQAMASTYRTGNGKYLQDRQWQVPIGQAIACTYRTGNGKAESECIYCYNENSIGHTGHTKVYKFPSTLVQEQEKNKLIVCKITGKKL